MKNLSSLQDEIRTLFLGRGSVEVNAPIFPTQPALKKARVFRPAPSRQISRPLAPYSPPHSSVCERPIQVSGTTFRYSFEFLACLFFLCYTSDMAYIPPIYPTDKPNITELFGYADDTDWATVDKWDAIRKELAAVIEELGVLPKAGYADVKARLDAIEAAAAGVPSGVIAMWSGLLANIPDGWSLCDGGDGRPNLLDKFVVCVPDAVTDPGGTGGAATHDHTVNNHTHAGGSHTHSQTGSFDSGELGGGDQVAGGAGVNTGAGSATTGGTAPGTDSKSNKPPYYVVAYIIKD